MGEMISNLYKIRWRKEKSKYKKEEMMRYNGKVKSSREIKKQNGRGKVGRSVTIVVDKQGEEKF